MQDIKGTRMRSLPTFPAARLMTVLACLSTNIASAQDEPLIGQHIEQWEQLMETVVMEPLTEGGGAFDGIKTILDPEPSLSGSSGGEQTTTNGNPDDNGGEPDPNDVPIDGGLTVLLVAGLGYGVRRQMTDTCRSPEP